MEFQQLLPFPVYKCIIIILVERAGMNITTLFLLQPPDLMTPHTYSLALSKRFALELENTVVAPFFYLHVPSLSRVFSLFLYLFTVGCTLLHVDSAHTSSCLLFVSRNWSSDYSGIRRSERRSRDQEYRHTSREADSWERERYGTTSPAHHRSSEDYWEYHSRRDGERSYSDRYARHKHFLICGIKVPGG